MTVIAIIILLAALGALVACIVAIIQPFSLGKFTLLNSRRNALIGVPVILVGSFLAVCMVALADISANPEKYPTETVAMPVTEKKAPAKTEPTPPAGVAAADAAISKVERIGDTLVVRVKAQPIFSADDLYDQVAMTVNSIGKTVKAGAPEAADATTINIVIETPMTDRLGNEAVEHIGTLVFSADDFRKANWDNLQIRGVLNLTQRAVLGVAARKAAAKWCLKNEEVGGAFCKAALE